MMVKERPVPVSEMKNVRKWGGDIEMKIIEGRPTPISKIKNVRSFLTKPVKAAK